MNAALEAPAGPYVVMTAWQCDTCDVQGRTQGSEGTCWNCGSGQVTVTARPSIRIDDL